MCDFTPWGGVLRMNEDIPVQSTEEGMTAPVDFTTFMHDYQDMVYTTAVRLLGNGRRPRTFPKTCF